MRFLHFDFSAGPENVVEVSLASRANVRLLDDLNYGTYRRGGSHRYYGGQAVRSPVHLVPPHYGHWNLVVDLGGRCGTVRAAVRVLGQS